MVKLFILGDINKRLLLPLLLALSQILNNIHSIKFPEKENNQILESYCVCIGKFMIILVPFLFKGYIKDNKDKFLPKKKCLHYFLLVLAYGSTIGLVFFSSLFNTEFDEGKENIKNPRSTGDFFKTGIEMIFMAVISIFLLKYKYFLHSYIFISAFIIFGLFTDILLDIFATTTNIGFASTVIDIIACLADAVNYCYQKYMMEKLYYPYWTIILIPAYVLFTINTLTFFTILAVGRDTEVNLFKSFYTYFDNVEVGYIIGKQLINIVLNFFIATFTILTLYNFTPDYVLISVALSKFVNVLLDDSNNKYYFIIFALLQFICLLFYLEIIELNFCGLNKNTRRNIQNRGEDDFFGRLESDSQRSSLVELSPGYFFQNKKEVVQETNIEMRGNPSEIYVVEDIEGNDQNENEQYK